MTTFLQFRLWWHGASVARRGVTVGAGALVMALFVWIAVPSQKSPTQLQASGSFGSGTNVQGSRGGPVPGGPSDPSGSSPSGSGFAGPGSAGAGAAGSGGASGGFTAGSNSPGGTSSPGPGGGPGEGPGGGSVGTAGCPAQRPNFKIGVSLIDIGAGSLNSTFGVPDSTEQKADWNAVFDSINKSGGVACHNLVGDFVSVNELDPATAQADCLQWAQDKVFAAVGGFLPTATDDCPLQHHIPFFEQVVISSADAKHYYPYYFSDAGEFQVVYRNFAHASQQMGLFDPAKGFRKVGIFYRDCQPEVNAALLSDLAEVGLAPNQVVRYDLGCPNGFASPSTIGQGILQFKAANVSTAIVDNAESDMQNISKVAQAQGFHPRWALPDNGIVAITESPQFEPDPNNFDGAFAVTATQYGAEHSGVPETAPTKQCDQIMSSHGLPTVMQSGDAFAGSTCSLTWMLVAGILHAPTLAPDQIAAGLQRAGSVPMSFGAGPNNFSVPGTTAGGQFWRAITFHSSCGCWKLADPGKPDFHPSF